MCITTEVLDIFYLDLDLEIEMKNIKYFSSIQQFASSYKSPNKKYQVLYLLYT